MTGFWNSWWGFAFMATPFVISLSGLAIGAYTTYHDLDEMQAHFPNSPCVNNSMRLWAGIDFPSRCQQTAAISGVVLWPKGFIRRGELDPEELRNFPPHLKRRAQLSFWLVAIGMAWLLLAVALHELTEG